MADRVRPWRTAFFGAISWSAAVGAGILFRLHDWADGWHAAAIATGFALGAVIAFPIAFFLVRPVGPSLGPFGRFVAFGALLGTATVGITAMVFAVRPVLDVALLHDHPFHLWAVGLLYSAAVAFYGFAVIGVRLYFPYAVAALVAFSLWFAVRPR